MYADVVVILLPNHI